MKTKITKKQVLEFLIRRRHAGISTVTPNGKPEAATIYYGIDKHFSLYFPTGTLSRKFKNIQKNPHVALAVTDVNQLITVQMEGVAKVLYSTPKDAHIIKTLSHALSPTPREALEKLWDPVPPVIKMKNGKLAILEVKIKWVRYADFSISAKAAQGQFYQIVKI
jgi:nitroimidazol reductase NimA-like FMN-containing flavoprotein (pyridoxamine 5'-phosphate oxidase superfamily)